MYYKFDVVVTEKDYFDFNKFYMTKSHYGKKQILTFRLIITAIMLLSVIISVADGSLSTETLSSIVPPLVFLLIFQIGLTSFITWLIKRHIKQIKKTGKMPYSSSSVIEFFEDSFSETTECDKTEHKYSVIERISIVNEAMIYIHINNTAAYILPVACFESNAQYWEFMDFIKTKNSNIEFY